MAAKIVTNIVQSLETSVNMAVIHLLLFVLHGDVSQ